MVYKEVTSSNGKLNPQNLKNNYVSIFQFKYFFIRTLKANSFKT